jgi:hypothetical protein
MDSITLTFTHLNDTKGTRRFAEVADEGQEVVGSLYVKKTSDFSKLDTLTVTISDGKPAAKKATRTSK